MLEWVLGCRILIITEFFSTKFNFECLVDLSTDKQQVELSFGLHRLSSLSRDEQERLGLKDRLLSGVGDRKLTRGSRPQDESWKQGIEGPRK